MQKAALETPEDFLQNYKARKSLRDDKYDPVAKNDQLSVDEKVLQKYYGQNLTGMQGGRSAKKYRGVPDDVDEKLLELDDAYNDDLEE